MPSAPEELLFALCHEVGNILAAVRLHSEFVEEGGGARISELTDRAGALVALVRPLLSPPPSSVPMLDPLELLEALQHRLDGARVRVELKSAVDLPGVEVEGEILQHLMLADLFAALEDLPERERVRVAAESSPEGVTFMLEVPGEATMDASPRKLTGRALTRALAAAILGKRGGSVAASGYDAGQRVRFSVPAAG